MKRSAIILIMSLILLSGCADRTKLGGRAIIQAAAVDYNNGYRVSALMFSGGGSGGDIDASQENVIKVVGEGETLAEAIDSISLADGKRLYMCETKLLILGEGFEEISAMETLRTLYFDMRCGLNMPVCYAKNAEALTDLHFTEGITSAEKPLSMIENANEMGVSPKTTLLDLLAENEGGEMTIIPCFEIVENGSSTTRSEDGDDGDSKTALLCGSRLIRSGKLLDSYNQAQTVGLLLRTGQTDKLMMNYKLGEAERSCEAYGIKIRTDGGRLTVSAKFRTRQGDALSEEERRAALNALTKIVEDSL